MFRRKSAQQFTCYRNTAWRFCYAPGCGARKTATCRSAHGTQGVPRPKMYFVQDHPPRLVSRGRSIAVTDLYRNCLLPVVIQMTEDDLQRVLESIARLKRSGAMEADELAHIERVTEQ